MWGAARKDHDVSYYVYILASRRHGTLYVGVTNSLERRVWEHREKVAAGFTKKYDVSRLVWWRGYDEVTEAIHFEKQLKRWRREWKIRLIEAENPDWGDLYPGLIGPQIPLPDLP
jgi:putative endonuclease